VIIDGSTDNSIAIAEKYAKVDKRIQVFEKENGGLSDARNYGLERAKGEFIYFMDSDDWIEANLLEKAVQSIEKEQTELVLFGYYQDDVDSDENLLMQTAKIPNIPTFHTKKISFDVTPELLGLFGYAWNKLYRKSFIDKHNLQFEKGTSLVEDILFNAQVYKRVSKITVVNEALYHYLNRPSATLIKQFHQNSFELKARKTKAVHSFLKTWGVSEKNLNSITASSLIQGIRYCIHNLFTFKNTLTYDEKKRYIDEMLRHPMTINYISHFETNHFKDKIYKYLIKNKKSQLLTFIASNIK
jgi:glycosyltransferase involved in cell wall biosynthesis